MLEYLTKSSVNTEKVIAITSQILPKGYASI